MIDTRSLLALSKSLPPVPREFEGLLMMKTRSEEAIPPATASLAQRGYIGCFPIAHIKGDEVVLRLQPGRPLNRTRIAVTYWSFTDGLTISPDLARFIAGRLAQLDTTKSQVLEQEGPRSKLLQFASEFGDTASTERVLDALPRARTLPERNLRSAALWEAADRDEPLFQVLAGAWSRSGAELGDWVNEAITRFPEEELVWRLYVAYHVTEGTGVDVTEAAWKVVMSDALFDATYNGVMPGPALNVWSLAPLVHAAQWLEGRSLQGLDKRRALSLDAARAFAREPEAYSGVEHLEAARALAGEDPTLAYVHAVSAGAFFVRATGKTPAASIVLCHELAQAQGWAELVQVLEWTLAELKG